MENQVQSPWLLLRRRMPAAYHGRIMKGQTTQKPRVILLHNYMTPYRAPLFAALAERFDLDVWILGDVRRIREWTGSTKDYTFRCTLVPHVEIPIGSRYNTLLINPTIRAMLERQPCDALVLAGWSVPAVFRTAAWARKTGVPTVLWSESTPREQSLVRTLTRSKVSRLVSSARAWVASGERAGEYLVSLGAQPEGVFKAYNAVENGYFQERSRLTAGEREALRERLGITTPGVLLYVGNLLELKGVGDLLEAFRLASAERDDMTLVLAGGGKREARYKEYCARHGMDSRVVFAGFVPRDELPAYYGLADALVLPSRTEVWGLVLNEAMACGLPVIASDAAGAMPDLVREAETGYVTPPRDPEALASAILKLFDPAVEREVMGEAGRRHVAQFTFERMADAFAAAVDHALGRGRV